MQFCHPSVRWQWRGVSTCNLLNAAGFDEVDARSNRMSEKDLRGQGESAASRRYATLFGICLFCASFASAQRVIVGVGVGPAYYGPAPVCAYGYYDYYPYACAPYGYYSQEWFVDGLFIGAGPWFHGFYGRPGFYGRGFYRGGYYGRGFYGRREFRERGWGRDGFRGRGFAHEGFEHDGFRGREF